jgi:hypothetical protein
MAVAVGSMVSVVAAVGSMVVAAEVGNMVVPAEVGSTFPVASVERMVTVEDFAVSHWKLLGDS